jgi:hypothetical protein
MTIAFTAGHMDAIATPVAVSPRTIAVAIACRVAIGMGCKAALDTANIARNTAITTAETSRTTETRGRTAGAGARRRTAQARVSRRFSESKARRRTSQARRTSESRGRRRTECEHAIWRNDWSAEHGARE